jgi:hypothetical protein
VSRVRVPPISAASSTPGTHDSPTEAQQPPNTDIGDQEIQHPCGLPATRWRDPDSNGDITISGSRFTDRQARKGLQFAYFVVAEALTNVLKHARAQQATVTGSVDDGMLNIEIRDDGIGGANPAGNGLVGIEDRVSALGGQLRVECPACGGTVVSAVLPIAN